MKLKTAYKVLNKISNVPFGDLFSAEDMELIVKNKGKTGQLLELALGMRLSNCGLDFEDGELKTNKCDSFGNPKETVFIAQISGMIDDLLQVYPFKDTYLFKKISNMLYVPVCKDGQPSEWMFLPAIHVDLSMPVYSELYEIWAEDYYSICSQLKRHVESGKDGFIHTSNGRHIQIRSKDAKSLCGRYHPIYSSLYGRYVSNKNHAFYFKKQFVKYIRRAFCP